jgi:hypothetical protein
MSATADTKTAAVHQKLAGGAVAKADAARAFGVTFGGSLLLDLAAGAALVATARALRQRRRPSWAAALGVAVAALYASAGRSWMDGWGMRDGEGHGHAVEIDAPPEAVWPWLAQIGQDRGGFYSYDWLENLAGCRLQNADTVHPDWQHRDIGDEIALHWSFGLPVTRWDPGRALAMEGWGSFELESLPDKRTRLIARGEPTHGVGRAFYELAVEIPHFVMERKMLLGIKQRAERSVE